MKINYGVLLLCILQGSHATNAPISLKTGYLMAAGVGAQQLLVNNPLQVTHPLFTNTHYQTVTNSEAVVAAEAGYHWKTTHPIFQDMTLSAYYNHLFPTNIGDIVTGNSPKKGRYEWSIASDVLLALGKVNLVQYQNVSPFFQAGLGLTFNHARNFVEKVTTNSFSSALEYRFSNHTQQAFAANVGVGLDWIITPQFFTTLSYQFQSLGSISSGANAGSHTTIRSNQYQSNLGLLKISYLVGVR